jgi:hypothetical protein
MDSRCQSDLAGISLLLPRSREDMGASPFYDVKQGLGVTFQALSVALGLPFLLATPCRDRDAQHKSQVPAETME